MRKAILISLVVIPFSFGGCKILNRVEEAKIVKSAKNVEVVANDLKTKPATAPHAIILEEQARTTLTAVDPDEDTLSIAQPDVSAEGLANDPEAEALKAQKQGEEDRKEIEESRSWGFLGFLKDATFWGSLGAAGLFVARMLLSKTGWGAPLAALIDAFSHKVPVVGPAIKKGQSALGAVESSMAGRYGLQALDKLLGDKYKDQIVELTGGKCATAEELFKYAAKTHAVDSATIKQTDVADLIDQIKDSMPTTGGLPTSIETFLKLTKNR